MQRCFAYALRLALGECQEYRVSLHQLQDAPYRSRSGWPAFGGMTMAHLLKLFSSATALAVRITLHLSIERKRRVPKSTL